MRKAVSVAPDAILIKRLDDGQVDVYAEFRCFGEDGWEIPTMRGLFHPELYAPQGIEAQATPRQREWKRNAEQLADGFTQRCETLIRRRDELATGGIDIKQIRLANFKQGARGTRLTITYQREGDPFESKLSFHRRPEEGARVMCFGAAADEAEAHVQQMLGLARAFLTTVNRERPGWDKEKEGGA